MQAASQSLQRHQFPEEPEAALEERRQLMNAAFEQVVIARELRETSGNLRRRNKGFRDFLRENCLAGLSLYEKRINGE